MKELTTIANKFRTDKGTIEGESHSFTEFYDGILKYNRNEKLNILEIGVLNGSSINMWAEYFPNANIYGIDIDLYMSNGKIINNNSKVFLCDGTNEEQINNFLNKIGNPKFDIIVDDGSHYNEHQMKSLLIFMNHLNDNGIYILEDLHCNILGTHGQPLDSPLYFLCFNNKPSYITNEEYKLLNNKISDIKMFINFNKKSDFKNRSITSIITFNCCE